MSLKENNIAVITGAGAGGIGFSVAFQLLKKYKLKVVLLDISSESLAESTKALIDSGISSTQFETIVCDVSSYEAVESLSKSIRKKYGHIDFLMLNAGVQMATKNYGGDISNWTKTLGVNLFGVINGVQAFVQEMVDQDTPVKIVITGSKQGITYPPGNPAYNVSKAGVRALSDSLSHQLLGTKATVNLLVPGYTFTKLTNSAGASEKPAAAWSADQVASELFERMDGEYYIICPDNDVNWALDSARMEWSSQDILKKRSALSRWNPEYKEEFEAHIKARTES